MAVADDRAALRMVEAAPDRRMMERMAAGDGDALRELYDMHARAVYSLALRMLRSQAEAEDVVQEVFVQAWRHAARYDAARATVAGWLLMQTKSRAIDRLRARKARPEQGDEAQRPEPVDASVSADVQIIRGEQAQLARDALEQLPTLQKTALELAYYEGLTHAEIAEQLEQPLGTVKTRIRQGLQKLRQALTGARTSTVERVESTE